MKKMLSSMLMIIVLVGITACQSGSYTAESSTQEADLTVTVSILPEIYFVERIGGSHVTVNVMVETGADPHVYEPKPEQMKQLNQSDLYFKIGVEFEEAWMDKFASINPDMIIVDVSEGIEKIPMAESIEITHPSEEEAHEHEEGLDPHIWLSPELVKQISKNIYSALAKEDPLNEPEYKSNLEVFLQEIEELQRQIRDSLAGNQDKPSLVFHPAWGYFADEFNLVQIAAEIGGNEPSPKELAEVITLAQENKIKIIFTSPQFSSRAAETIAAELGGQVLTIDPLAQDWMRNMREVAEVFREVIN